MPNEGWRKFFGPTVSLQLLGPAFDFGGRLMQERIDFARRRLSIFAIRLVK